MHDRILIVEDERDIAVTLDYALRREHFHVQIAGTGQEALLRVASEPRPDLVLLDLMLPDMPGTEVCRRIRADPKTHGVLVIIVTAKSDEIDRVVGFEVGADDYISKPFSMRELLLRIRAVLRRAGPEAPSTGVVGFGRLKVDHEGHRLWVDGEEVVLTAQEFRLFALLFARRGRVQTREMILADIWGVEPENPTRTLDTHVVRLRRKLGAASQYLQTARSVGYRFVAHPDEDPEGL